MERELPTVRIQKVILENFKSVIYGEIEMACGRKEIPCDTQSDILGIYGQNGSGKTSLIEALSIIQHLMSGLSVPDDYADCIKEGANEAKISCQFDFQYDAGYKRKVVYEVLISRIEAEENENEDMIEVARFDSRGHRTTEQHLVKVSREIVKVSGDLNGEKISLQKIIDTGTGEPFGPVRKKKELFDGVANSNQLIANKTIAWTMSQSFVFMDETTDIFEQKGGVYSEIIHDLKLFARFYMYVIDTKSTGMISLNVGLPVFFRVLEEGVNKVGVLTLPLNEPGRFPDRVYKTVELVLEDISNVLNKFIPGMSLGLRSLGPVLSKKGSVLKSADVVTIRNGIEMPLRYESDGVKKIISILQLFSEAFNDRSMTIAIDEFDAGVFEYLLGEMLTIFEEYGKGQLIFTSHNLRPLEVINKEYICFTTTDPEDRYTRIDNIKPNNNLRKVYYREIELGGEEVDLYESEKRYKIIQALRKAGRTVVKESEKKK